MAHGYLYNFSHVSSEQTIPLTSVIIIFFAFQTFRLNLMMVQQAVN